MKVTAILVSHNGARWLPAVLAGLADSTVLPDRILTVDTGSTDASPDLLEQTFGTECLRLDPATPYGDAVAAALATAPPAVEDEWVWLLHDDANPDPACLEQLRAVAAEAPVELAVLGPKLREWPSLRRLLEVGVTLTGTGRRETGLEPGEYDQGQHDRPHTVLAVNTAGMLVRRSVLESVAFDPHLPVFGTDVDFGWRVARAGLATRTVPDAVMFHDQAARAGLRETGLVARPLRQERAAVQYTLMVNSPGWTLPFRTVRMLVGGLLRAFGLLLVRAPSEALDEVAALTSVFLHPGRIIAARRVRAGTAAVRHRDMRHLLAPFWLPYRHGLDYAGDVAYAVVTSVREQAERRRPGSAETALLPALLRTPAAWGLLAALVLAWIAGPSLTGGDPLHGGALLAAPDGVGHWWSAWAASHHTVGIGSAAPGPAYLLPLAILGSVMWGATDTVLALLLLLCVPLAYLGAWRLLRRLTQSRWIPVWGGFAYALLPVVGGALGQGRLGTIVAAMVLPWVAGSAMMLDDPNAVARWRAAWRTAIGAAVLIAFVPPAWPLLAVLVLLGVIRFANVGLREAAVVLVVPLVTCLPWLLGTLRSLPIWLFEGGRIVATTADPAIVELLLGRAGGPAAPGWISAGLVLAGLVALVRPDTRGVVAGSWGVAAVTTVMLAAALWVPVHLPGLPAGVRPWAGFWLLVIHAALIVAIAVAADGIGRVFAGTSFGWRQPLAGIALIGAVAMPVVGAVWWLTGPSADVGRTPDRVIPEYMTELARGNNTSAALRLWRGSDGAVEYDVLRSGPLRTGDDGILALTAIDQDFTDLIGRLLADPQSSDSQALADLGIKYVYAAAPVPPRVSAGLDSAPGLGGASAPARGSRAWIVQHDTTTVALDATGARWRPLWAAGSVLCVVVAIVLAAPDRRRRR